MAEQTVETPADVAVRVTATAATEALREALAYEDEDGQGAAALAVIESVGALCDAVVDRRVTTLMALVRAEQTARGSVPWEDVAAAVRRGLARTPDGDVNTFVTNIVAELRGVLA